VRPILGGLLAAGLCVLTLAAAPCSAAAQAPGDTLPPVQAPADAPAPPPGAPLPPTPQAPDPVAADTVAATPAAPALPGAPPLAPGAAGDSLQGDALYRKLVGESEPGQIVYQGERLTLYPSDQVILLSGKAHAEQDSTVLTAERIAYVRDENIIQAFGGAMVQRGANSLASDTLFFDQGSGEVSTFGPSTLREAGKEVSGQNLKYSMDRRSGLLASGKTTYERWYLRGEDMSKIGERTFVVQDGTFTTDPAEVPDYHFGASDIKLKQGDVIIAKPVVLFVSDVPIFYLPWYVEPLGQGRKSGILRPSIGINTLINANRDERNVQDLGFYWAINDYMDGQAALDWFSESRTILRFDFRYALRYLLRGSAHYEHVWNRSARSRDTLLRLAHDHEFDTSTYLRVDANFATSRSFFQRNSFDPNRLLQRALRSNASFGRRFTWGNLSVGASSDFRLQEDRTDFKLPQLNLSLNTRPLFPGSRLDRNWKQNLQIGAATSFDFDLTTQGDSLTGRDSTLVNAQTSITRATLSGPFDLFGFINTNPSLDFTETLFNNNALPDSLAAEGADGFGNLETFGASLSFAANVFRVFQGGPGPVTKVRHTFSPQLSFRYQPATTPREELPLGFPGGGGAKALSAFFTMANNIDIKVRETTEQAQRREDDEDRIRRAREAGLLKPRAELTLDEQMQLDSIAVADSLAKLEAEVVEDSTDAAKERLERRVETPEEVAGEPAAGEPAAGEAAAGEAAAGEPAAGEAAAREAEAEAAAAAQEARVRAEIEAKRGAEAGAGVQPAGEAAAEEQFTERSIRLFSLRNRVGFDFVRNSDPRLLGLSSLSSDLSTEVSGAVSFNVSANHDLVDTRPLDDAEGTTEEFFDPFLSSLNTSVRFGGGQEVFGGRYLRGQRRFDEQVNDAEAGQGALSDGVGLGDEPPGFEAVQSSSLGRWEVDLTHSLSRQREAESRQSVRFGTSFNPTENWHLRYGSGYNITDGEFQDQTVSLVRELNRWQATLSLYVFPAEPQDRVLVEFAVFLRDIPDLRIPYRTRRE
jgi:hypothetical protein